MGWMLDVTHNAYRYTYIAGGILDAAGLIVTIVVFRKFIALAARRGMSRTVSRGYCQRQIMRILITSTPFPAKARRTMRLASGRPVGSAIRKCTDRPPRSARTVGRSRWMHRPPCEFTSAQMSVMNCSWMAGTSAEGRSARAGQLVL